MNTYNTTYHYYQQCRVKLLPMAMAAATEDRRVNITIWESLDNKQARHGGNKDAHSGAHGVGFPRAGARLGGVCFAGKGADGVS